MNSEIPKQYMDLCGYPVLYYSLKAFEDSAVDEIVLVTGSQDIDFCRRNIVEKYAFSKVKTIVAGGSERYLSVYEGLQEAPDADYVLIHDGARPLIDQEAIRHSMEVVAGEKACVLAVRVKDTIKVADCGGYVAKTPDRNGLWAVQTPQSFSAELLRQAYQRLLDTGKKGTELPAVTDDAMLVEQMTGQRVRIIDGSYRNIKITTPEDLLIARAFLQAELPQ